VLQSETYPRPRLRQSARDAAGLGHEGAHIGPDHWSAAQHQQATLCVWSAAVVAKPQERITTVPEMFR
jgi:hypothetical protein